ncbi:MAG: electron transport complex subunit RsxC [Pirellulales bacterium]|nr:electron transport complex subunit RsxC [Pirellulales bacterium]
MSMATILSKGTFAKRPFRKRSFKGGIYPPEQKGLAAGMPIEVIPTPEEVRLPLLQHLGAPCKQVIEPRSQVQLGDIIGRAKGFISAPIHASLRGTTARVSATTLPAGRRVDVIPIKADETQPFTDRAVYDEIFGGDWAIEELNNYDPEQIANTARDAGLVGLGGATFPTHIKLRRNKEKPISHMLINGAECEPYLTADYRLMLEAPRPVISGAILAGRAVDAEHVTVCIENNKPKAIKALRNAAEGTNVSVCVLKTKYPQGGEKQLISAVLGKTVPLGGLPLDVGVVVLNVGTTAALARAVLRGRPLTHRVVTVSGKGVMAPKNLLVPIGTSFRYLIDYCGGLNDVAQTVIAGGPMMGFAVGSLDIPVTKGTSGITVLTQHETRRFGFGGGDGSGQKPQTPCLRCGRCVSVCPMNLVPGRIAQAARTNHPQLAERYHADACVECGCCAFECPANIPVVQLIRLSKAMLRRKT